MEDKLEDFQMKKIERIPIIGYIVRLVCGVLKLPKHIDAIYNIQKKQCEDRKELSENIALVMTLQQDIQQKNNELCNKLRQVNEDINDRIRQVNEDMHSLVLWNDDRMAEIQRLQVEIANLIEYNQDRMNEISKLNSLQVDGEYVKKLNWLLSVSPTIWGDEAKLNISELAAVGPCFFNTNSGKITVGDYTFAGSGVSLLAGSHDKDLNGLIRRDAEMKDGYDITIGKGVWLASNCTILGPATIGDNAVVAAGAVVIPGTEIPPNEIYAGVPARKIGTVDQLDISKDYQENIHILRAIERENGVLFADGWTDKQGVNNDVGKIEGHYMLGTQALLLTTDEKLKIRYFLEGEESCQIEMMVDNNAEMKICENLRKSGTLTIVIPKYEENKVHSLIFVRTDREKKVLFAKEQ